MPTDAKTNESRLENGVLHLLLSAGNTECPALHGSKQIMQRCNAYGHKIRNDLQRCKCRTNEKSRGNLDLGMTWAYSVYGKWLLCMIFTKRKTNAALQQFTKTIWHETNRALLPDVFYKWDRLWTNLRQKAGYLSGRSSWNIHAIMGGICWKMDISVLDCCLHSISWNISNRIPTFFQKDSIGLM